MKEITYISVMLGLAVGLVLLANRLVHNWYDVLMLFSFYMFTILISAMWHKHEHERQQKEVSDT